MSSSERDKVITALIVDDERLARKEMAEMLAAFPFIQIVGEADGVDTAIAAISKYSPDVLFLDIQMPRKSGFDLLNETDYDGKVIFVTAYDEFALRAFEINAMDYLLKPVSPERLENSIRRLREEKPLPGPVGRKLRPDDRLFLTFGNHLRFISVGEIAMIRAERDYSMLFLTNGKSGLVSKPMKEWEMRLPENLFCRIHRSSIINMERVEKVDKWFNSSLRIQIRGLSEPLTISKRYATMIREKFG
jgi:two-component system LytT family response regulator